MQVSHFLFLLLACELTPSPTQSNLRRHLKIHRGQSATGASTPTDKDGSSSTRAGAGAAGGLASDEDMAEVGGSPSDEGSEGKAQ